MTTHKRILLAPSAYKGTLSAAAVAEAMREGIHGALPDTGVELAPIADGGDGTLDAIKAGCGGVFHKVSVRGALDEPVEAAWLELDKLAIVELACASGIGMLHGRTLQALDAHSFGTGQVMLDCFNRGFRDLVVCVGGSASTDGGAGVLQALGARFLDRSGNELSLGGGALRQIEKVDLSGLKQWKSAKLRVATDVTSPLLGPRGAAHIFGPQKGANQEQVKQLDDALRRFADVLEKATGRYGRDIPGSGAAGGTAFGVACALGGEIVPGFQWLSELIGLKDKIARCDLVITGEGCLDHQSLTGKATGELAKMCARAHKPLWAVPAIMEKGLDWRHHGIERVIEASQNGGTVDASTLAACLRDAF